MPSFVNEKAFDKLNSRSRRTSAALSASFWDSARPRSGQVSPSVRSEETNTSFEDRTDDEDHHFTTTGHDELVRIEHALEMQESSNESRAPRIADWAAGLPTPRCARFDLDSTMSKTTARATPRLTIQSSNLRSLAEHTPRPSKQVEADIDDLLTPTASHTHHTYFSLNSLRPDRNTDVAHQRSRSKGPLGQSPICAQSATPIDDGVQPLSAQMVTPIDDSQALSPGAATTVFESETSPDTPAEDAAMSYGEGDVTEFDTEVDEPMSMIDQPEAIILPLRPAPAPLNNENQPQYQHNTFMSRRELRRQERRGTEQASHPQRDQGLERSHSHRQQPHKPPSSRSADDDEIEAASARSVGSAEWAVVKRARKAQKRRIRQWLDKLEIPDMTAGGQCEGYGIASAWC